MTSSGMSQCERVSARTAMLLVTLMPVKEGGAAMWETPERSRLRCDASGEGRESARGSRVSRMRSFMVGYVGLCV